MAVRASTGNWAATANSFNPAVTGTTIDAAAFNALLAELQVEITDSLSRSGKGGMLADLDMSANSIRNLASASAASDAVRFDQLTNLSATYETRVSTLSAAHSTLSATFTTLSAAHTTLSAAHTTLSAAFNTLSSNFAQRDYIVLSAAGTLANERVLTMGGGLSANDAGAGSTLTISLANLTASSVLGVLAAGVPAGLSQTQLTTLVNPFVGDSGAGGTKGLVPAPGVGDATKFLRGDATFVTIPGGGDMLAANNLSDVASAASAFVNIKQAATQAVTGVVELASAGDYWAAVADKALEASATWQAGAVQTLTDALTVSADFSKGINFRVDLALATAYAMQNPVSPKVGQSGAIYINQVGGARTISFGSAWKFAGGTAPALSTSLSTASAAMDILSYHVMSATYIAANMLKNVK